MNNWLESIYSAGTPAFASNPSPALFETVTIKLRMYEDVPAKHAVFYQIFPERFPLCSRPCCLYCTIL